MNALDLLRDVLDTANAGTLCPCASLPHVGMREDSQELLEALTTLVSALSQSSGGGLKHALVAVLATGYAIGASDTLDAMALSVPDFAMRPIAQRSPSAMTRRDGSL